MAAAVELFELLDFVLLEACGLFQQNHSELVYHGIRVQERFRRVNTAKVPTLTSARTTAFFFQAEVRRIMI